LHYQKHRFIAHLNHYSAPNLKIAATQYLLSYLLITRYENIKTKIADIKLVYINMAIKLIKFAQI